jgi:hypothetical protein
VTIICIVNSLSISQSFLGSIAYIAKKGMMMIITYEKCTRENTRIARLQAEIVMEMNQI